jgi:hypothetical protein
MAKLNVKYDHRQMEADIISTCTAVADLLDESIITVIDKYVARVGKGQLV